MLRTKYLAKIVFIVLYSLMVVIAQVNQDAPSVISPSVPRYPPIARAAGASGTVKVEVLIKEDGNVVSTKSVGSIPLFRKVAEDAALKWQFAPLTKCSGSRHAQLTFTFRIMLDKTPKEELKPYFVTPYHVEIRQVPPEPLD
jgi:TonB family protein